MPTFYDILGVDPRASADEIREAYRARARELHPDVHPEDRREWAARRFKELQEAYETLRDESARDRYDQRLARRETADASVLSEAPRHAACFYHPARSAVAVCPACGRPVCERCDGAGSACRVCRITHADPAASAPLRSTEYSRFADRVERVRERESAAKPESDLLVAFGWIWYTVTPPLAATLWVFLALFGLLGKSPILGSFLTLLVCGALAGPMMILLRRQTRKVARVVGLGFSVLLVGGALAWALMPWLGDRLSGVNVSAAEACYRRGVVLSLGWSLVDASNLRCKAGDAELAFLPGALVGERRGVGQVVEGYGDQLLSTLTGVEASRVNFTGAREALERADAHYARAESLRYRGPGFLGRERVRRMRALLDQAESADRAAAEARAAEEGGGVLGQLEETTELLGSAE